MSVLRRSTLLFVTVMVLLPAAAADRLTVVSWGGAYVKSQMLGFILPYEEVSGTTVDVLEYTGGIDEVRSQVRSWNVRWDVVDMELFDAQRACRENLLMPFDHDTLPPAPDGTPAREDFIEGSLLRCGIGNVVAATVVAYDQDRIEQPPQSIEDFFDVQRFPGRRGLRRSPKVNLEWALIADGVPREEVYRVLNTDEGVERAFRVLSRIKPWVDWWRSGEEAIRLLETGRVSMTSVFNGRVFDAVQRGENFAILWDHQVWFMDVWVIPRNGRRTEQAADFIRFATNTESLARQMRHIPYGPVRRSALERIDPEIRRQLPTAAENTATAIEGDAEWWAANLDRLTGRFERWLERPVMVPRELPN
ncbi:MAG: extracellular solute-binding protein [Gammaproteobacteria bacterium]|nr:extracellular solute-binding protein [Gammaproteobacteria bacterium]